MLIIEKGAFYNSSFNTFAQIHKDGFDNQIVYCIDILITADGCRVGKLIKYQDITNDGHKHLKHVLNV